MNGFTLIELLVVVLILGVLASMAVPMMASSVDAAKLDAATSELATALHYAQRATLATGQACRVEFDIVQESVQVQRMTHSNMAAILDIGQATLAESVVDTNVAYVAVSHPVRPMANYVVDFDDESRMDGVNIVSATFGASSIVSFNRYGTPSSGGAIVVSYAGKQRTIALEAMTGTVTITN